LAIYKAYLDAVEPTLENVDLSRVWVGTLHSLCNDIMQKYRYHGYQNVRLLDDLEQLLFIYDHSDLASYDPPLEHLDLWSQFEYMVNGYDPIRKKSGWSPDWGYPPNRWMRSRATVPLLNRIVEDMVDVEQMT